jgi:hypothetical protein
LNKNKSGRANKYTSDSNAVSEFSKISMKKFAWNCEKYLDMQPYTDSEIKARWLESAAMQVMSRA